MITEATPAEDPIAAQIYALAQAAYTLEAKQIGCADFPPLRESLDDLRRSSDSFLVFRLSAEIVGALSFTRSANSLVITRLVVSPAHLRRGIATALHTRLEGMLASGVRFTVSTAQSNTPAIALYHRLGYTEASFSTSAEGIPLLHLIKPR